MYPTCDCSFCKTYIKYTWAKIKECGCGCHKEDDPTGHESLCCEFPNVNKNMVPYKALNSAEFYRSILDKMKEEEEKL